MRLSERALLVNLHVRVWTNSKIDRRVTAETNENYDAANGASRVTKRLVSSNAMKEISQVVSTARGTHRVLTLPWDDNGVRIITTRGYNHYAEKMSGIGRRFHAVTRSFIKEYPDHIEEARRTTLGKMFNEADYPTIGELKQCFSLDVEPKPLPDASDFRAKLSDDQTRIIVADIERRSNERVEKAMRNVWERVHELVTRLVERIKAFNGRDILDGRGSRFESSCIENIRELTELMPSLNINDDPEIDAINARLASELCSVTVDRLKTDSKIRARTKKSADDILRKVRDFIN